MELEKFEEVYQVLEAQKEKDETAAELYADVKEFAYKYATMRYRFSEMSREEKAENDSLPHQPAQPVHGQCPYLFPLSTEQRGECAGHQRAGSGSEDFR